MNDTETTWQIDPQIRFRRIFDESVVVHQEKPNALVLNEVGTTFLELCDGIRSLQEIVDTMRAQYDVDPAVLQKDVLKFAEALRESGVIDAVK